MKSKNVMGKQKGIAMVEFTVALLVLIPLLLGIIDFGRVMQFGTQLSTVSEAGALYAYQTRGSNEGALSNARAQDIEKWANCGFAQGTSIPNTCSATSPFTVSVTKTCSCSNPVITDDCDSFDGGGGTATCNTTPSIYYTVTSTGVFTPITPYINNLIGTPYSVSRTESIWVQ